MLEYMIEQHVFDEQKCKVCEEKAERSNSHCGEIEGNLSNVSVSLNVLGLPLLVEALAS